MDVITIQDVLLHVNTNILKTTLKLIYFAKWGYQFFSMSYIVSIFTQRDEDFIDAQSALPLHCVSTDLVPEKSFHLTFFPNLAGLLGM